MHYTYYISTWTALISALCLALFGGGTPIARDASGNPFTVVQDTSIKPPDSSWKTVESLGALEHGGRLSKRAFSLPNRLKGLVSPRKKKATTDPKPVQLELNPLANREELEDHLSTSILQLQAAAKGPKDKDPIDPNDFRAQAQNLVRRRNAVVTAHNQAQVRFEDTKAQVEKDFKAALPHQPKTQIQDPIAQNDPDRKVKELHQNKWNDVQQSYVKALEDAKGNQMRNLASERQDLINRAKGTGNIEDVWALGDLHDVDMTPTAKGLANLRMVY
jgi:hypothetical protein